MLALALIASSRPASILAFVYFHVSPQNNIHHKTKNIDFMLPCFT